ncbi:MAG: hypothetical protein HDS54_01190 [Barnesiella sp.]|nr:hypothetical protein [Barnesiella sp.]
MKLSAILPTVMVLSAGCRSAGAPAAVSDTYPDLPEVVRIVPAPRGQGLQSAIPRAVIYRTNGDYDDHVVVNLDASRTGLESYPAPGDVSESSSPVVMADGWLLDRRGGVGLNSAFLDWTYAEYSHLPATPSPAEIMAHVIPDARVTAVTQLPIPAMEALGDTATVNAFIRQLPESPTPNL